MSNNVSENGSPRQNKFTNNRSFDSYNRYKEIPIKYKAAKDVNKGDELCYFKIWDGPSKINPMVKIACRVVKKQVVKGFKHDTYIFTLANGVTLEKTDKERVMVSAYAQSIAGLKLVSKDEDENV